MIRPKKPQLSPEERQKKSEIEGQFGDDCSFFSSPIGLIAMVAPEQPSETFWKAYVEEQRDGLDKTAVLTAFVLRFVHYPEPQKVREVLRARPALAVRMASAGRKLLGSDIEPDPELAEESKNAATLEELRQEHGEVSWYDVPSFGLVVLAAPSNPASYRQFYNAIQDGANETNPEETYTTFALDCVVHPSRESVEKLLEQKPALARKFANRGDGLLGGDFQELGKG